MERRPTSIRTTLALAALALTLIAPWALGQDPDTITEIRLQAEQGDASAQYNLGVDASAPAVQPRGQLRQRRGCPQGRGRGRALVSALSRSGERLRAK